jgi:ABC-type anion transport system duplicated permease subunit
MMSAIIARPEWFGLRSTGRFTTVEVPASMHSLIWNSMMSFGGGWFFVAQSEAISVMNKESITSSYLTNLNQLIKKMLAIARWKNFSCEHCPRRPKLPEPLSVASTRPWRAASTT